MKINLLQVDHKFNDQFFLRKGSLKNLHRPINIISSIIPRKAKFISILFFIVVLLNGWTINGQTTVSQGFESGTNPPSGWTLTGSYTNYFYVVTNGSSPTTSPHGGSYQFEWNSYSASSGYTSALISPVFSESSRGSNTPTITFWFYRDVSAYNSTTYDGEGVTVYINTSASVGGTSLGFVPRRGGQATSGSYISGTSTVSTSQWVQYTCTMPAAYNGNTNYLIFNFTSKYGNNCFMDDISYQTYPCVPPGDQSSYGANGIWNGYVYTGTDLNTYMGYITAGTAGNENFTLNWGTGYPTGTYVNTCATTTSDNFSVRFKTNKTYTPGYYYITTASDDGVRISSNGGSSWNVINDWSCNASTRGATTYLSGSTNLVMDMRECGGSAQANINVCQIPGDQTSYGSGSWIGYAYNSASAGAFTTYLGYVTENETFNRSHSTPTGATTNLACITPNSDLFAIRYKMNKTFTAGWYNFTVGGDDGVRLSIDGGSTWLVNGWGDHGYTTYSSGDIYLDGNYNLVFEYYENTGGAQSSFSYTYSACASNCTSYNFGTTYTPTTTPATHASSTPSASACKIYAFNVTAGREYVFSTCSNGGSYSGDSKMWLYDGSCTELTSVDDYCGTGPQITYTATYTGLVYLKMAHYSYSSSVSWTLAYWMSLLPGENCTNAQNLATLSSPYTSTTVGYADDISTCRTGYPDRVFYLSVPNGYTIDIWESSNDYDEYEYVGYGSSCSSTTQINCWDNDGLAHTTWTNTLGSTQTVWYIQDAYSGSGSFTLNWTLTCVAPSQPSSISGATAPDIGSSQGYSVTNVSGITYSWSVPSGWSINSGQGSNSITVTVGTTNGNITVTPTNVCGSSGTAQTLATAIPAYRMTYVSMSTGSASWCAGETRTVSVTLKNNGVASWTNSSPDINIGCKWNQESDFFTRTDGNSLAPGSTATFSLNMTAPSTPGTNNLSFSAVYEGCFWFHGNPGSASCSYGSTTSSGNSVSTSAVQTILNAAPTVSAGSPAGICLGSNTQLNGSASVTLGAMPTGYCSSYATNTADSRINYVGINTIANSTNSGCQTYRDYTGLSTDLTISSSYTLTVMLGTCGGNYTKTASAWIDWNRNGVFESGEIVMTSQGSGTGDQTVTSTVTVPAASYPGTTRMRVICVEGSTTDACYVYSYGETQDYSVRIIPNYTYSWSPSTGLSATNIFNPTANPSSTTIYTLTSGFTGACTTNTSSVTISVNTPSTTGLASGDYVWTGTGNTNWNTNNNWFTYNGSGFVSTTAPNASTANIFIRPFGSSCISNQPVINFSGATCNNLTIESGASVNLASSNALNVYGNFTSNGTFTGSSGSTVVFTGSNGATMSGSSTPSFYNLTINKGSSSTVVGCSTYPLSVSNDLTVSAGQLTFGYSGSSWSNIGNNFTVSSGATFNHNVNWNGYSINVSGNLAIDGSYTRVGYAPLINMNGSGTKYIKGTNLGYLTLQNGNFFANGNVSCNQNFWPMWGTGGSLHTNGYSITATAGLYNNGGTVYVDGGSLNVTGSSYFGYSTYSGSLNVSSGTFNCDNINVGDGTRTGTLTHSGGTITATGNFTVNPSCSYTSSGTTGLNVAGTYINNGTFNSGSGTVTFNGASQTINGSTSFYNVRFSGSGTKTIGSGTWSSSGVSSSYTTGAEIGDGVVLSIGSGVTWNFDTYGLWGAATGSPKLLINGGTVNFLSDGNLRSNTVLDVRAGNLYLYDDCHDCGVLLQSGGLVDNVTSGGDQCWFRIRGGSQLTGGTLKLRSGNSGTDRGFNITGSITATDGHTLELTGTYACSTMPAIDNSAVIQLGNVIINQSHGVNLGSGASLSIMGNLTINNGYTLNSNSNSFTVYGNWSNSGTFNPGTGTVYFSMASGTRTIDNGSSNFYNILHNGAGSIQITGSNLLTNNVFENSAGTFDANGFTHGVGGNAIVSGGSYLAGSGTNNFNGIGLTISGGVFTGSTGGVNVTNLSLNSGTLTAPSGSFNVLGDWTNNGGTFSPGSNTVTFNGSGAQAINGSVASQTFYNIVLNKTSGTTLSVGGSTANLTTNNLSENTGNFTAPATLNVNGNISISSNTTHTAGSNTFIKGNWTNTGTFAPNYGTVTFNGTTGTSGIATGGTGTGKVFYNLSVASSNDVTLAGDIQINNNYTLTSSTGFNCNSYTMNISGDFIHNGGTFNRGTGTVTLTGTGKSLGGSTATIFRNLIVNGSYTLSEPYISMEKASSVGGDLTIAGSLAASDKTINIQGNFTNNGTFTPGTGTVTLNGTTAQSISGTGSFAFNNLTLNNTGTNGTNNLITPSKAISVNGTLTMTNGILVSTPTNLLTMNAGSSSTAGTSTSFVQGPVKKIGNTAFTFPVGDIQGSNIVWAPIGISAPSLVTDAFTATYSFTAPPAPWNPGCMTDTLDHASGKENWDLSRTTGSSNVFLTLYFKDLTRSQITHPGRLRVVHWNSTTQKWENLGIAQYIDDGGGAGRIVSKVAASSFSPFTFGAKNDGGNPLPVELTEFKGICKGDTRELIWKTATETNNDYFTIESSKNGLDWTVVTTVPGSGNSNVEKTYSYSDATSETVLYYRLKQTDFNGQNKTFNPITVSCSDTKDKSISIFPNPFQSLISVSLYNISDENIVVNIYDMYGKLVEKSTYRISNGFNNMVTLDMGDLPSGVYYLEVKATNYVKSTKIVKNK